MSKLQGKKGKEAMPSDEKTAKSVPVECPSRSSLSDDLEKMVFQCLNPRPLERPSIAQLLENPIFKKCYKKKV